MRPFDIASSAAAFLRQNSLLNSVGSAFSAILSPLKHAAASLFEAIGKRPGMWACLIAASIITALVVLRPDPAPPDDSLFEDPAFETVAFPTDDEGPAPVSDKSSSDLDEPAPLLAGDLPKLVPGLSARTPFSESSLVTTADAAVELPSHETEPPTPATASTKEPPQWPHRGAVAQADFQPSGRSRLSAASVPAESASDAVESAVPADGAQLLGTIEEIEEQPASPDAPALSEPAFSFPPRN